MHKQIILVGPMVQVVIPRTVAAQVRTVKIKPMAVSFQKQDNSDLFISYLVSFVLLAALRSTK